METPADLADFIPTTSDSSPNKSEKPKKSSLKRSVKPRAQSTAKLEQDEVFYVQKILKKRVTKEVSLL